MVNEISKGKIAERVLRVLNSGKDTVEQKVKQQDAELAVSQARDKALFLYMSLRKSEGFHDFPMDILVEKEITATRVGSIHTARLPSRPLSLFSGNTGIHAIFPLNDVSLEIIPASSNHQRLYYNQEAFSMEGMPYYVPFQQDLKIYNFEGGKECKVLVQYIQAGEAFTSDEYFCVPPEIIDDVVSQALQMLGMQKQNAEDRFTDAKES